MPAVSPSQRRLMAAAEHGATFPEARRLRQTMTHTQLHDFAATTNAAMRAAKKGSPMKLTAAARHALPDTAFALSGRRYPIHNVSHARNALARVSEFGTPQEQAMVHAKVAARFPHLAAPKMRTGLKPAAVMTVRPAVVGMTPLGASGFGMRRG